MGLSTGTQLRPYEIVSAIGAGGMGEVYCAWDAMLRDWGLDKAWLAREMGKAEARTRPRMTPDRWQQIQQLYHAALTGDQNQRAAFLREACAGDDALRQEIESLLVHGAEAKSFVEAPALEAAKLFAENQSQSFIGRQMGSYQIVSLLGTGGMGEVYEARDTKLGRNVAIKILPAGVAHDPDRLSRFQREARILAVLNHPNIATIHGLEQFDGVHYLVMEQFPARHWPSASPKARCPWTSR